MFNPAEIETMTKEELVEAYSQTIMNLEDLTAQKQVLKDNIVSKMRGNAEIVGDYEVNRRFRKGDFDISIEQAEEYGATNTVIKIDTKKLNALEKEGVELKRKNGIEWLEVKPK